MSSKQFRLGYAFTAAALLLLTAAALLLGAGCASSQGSPPILSGGINSAQPATGADSVQSAQATRCSTFRGTFDEHVACQRANGTLGSFGEHQITWRVRYFVRFQRMPCGEMPTVKEGYVFHMVTNDLYSDTDLNDAQRIAIRNAMSDGKEPCQ